MATTAEWLRVEDATLLLVLEEAAGKLDGSDEVLLDFAGVQRIDPAAVSALERLAVKAEEKGPRVTLRGVNVGIYKVLKLARLAPRLSFTN